MTRKCISNGIDLVFSFDTAGSMYPCLAEVRRKITRLADRLFGQIPDLRIGIIAHGDYCDASDTYVLLKLDLTDKRDQIAHFIQNVGPTGGGDAEECYELVLHEARSMTWQAERSRVLVLIGDNRPHSQQYSLNTKKLDWQNKAKMLKQSGIQVHGVQCLNFAGAESFYRTLAELTSGLYLKLDQFRHIENLLLGIAYRQDSAGALEAYEQELRSRGIFNCVVEEIFDSLSGRVRKQPKKRKAKLEAVDPSRFQIFEVEGEPSIRDFVQSMGIRFEKGRGFYPHVSRTETIQENKEIILEDLKTGEMSSGAAARNMIDLPYGNRGRIKANPVPGYKVWVQSTSVNRKLREKEFMYEVPEKA